MKAALPHHRARPTAAGGIAVAPGVGSGGQAAQNEGRW